MQKQKVRMLAVAALIAVSAVSNVWAIAGVGFHWGFDLSLGMKDARDEPLKLPFDRSNLPQELADLDFFRVSLTDWKASAINFGGKAYIDFIPVIEAIELSCNFGLWQYKSALDYIDVENTVLGGGTPVYKTINLTLEDLDMSKYIGLTGTPYAKLQLDATVRKTLLNLWLIKLSGGAGLSAHFATPLLTAPLIEDALGAALTTAEAADIDAILSDPKNGEKILKEIIDKAMGKPAFGAHVLLGVKAKIPVVPIGVYIDGKYMIPFSKFDKDAVGKGVNGFGLLVNAGLSLSI